MSPAWICIAMIFFCHEVNIIVLHLEHIGEVFNMEHTNVEGYSTSCTEMDFSAYEDFNSGL